MISFKTVLLCTIIANIVLCERVTRTFTVSKVLPTDATNQKQKVANILFHVDQQYSEASADVQLVYEYAVDLNSVQGGTQFLWLVYQQEGTNVTMQEVIRKEDIHDSNFKELFEITTNQAFEVVAINYSQKKLKRKEIGGAEAMVMKSQQGKDHVLTYVQTKKAKEGQEQKTFFQKYQWYIIGFVALMFVMSKADPEAMQQQMQQQQQGQRQN